MIDKVIMARFILTAALYLGLSGCNALQTKPEPDAEAEQVDIVELRQKANEAYINDDFEAAEDYYSTLIKELPQEPEHWFRLANIYVATDRPYASMNLYREAVIREPEFTKAWYNLSIVQLKQTAFSLNEMMLYADKQDPLYSKAAQLLEDIKDIISE